MSKESLRDLRYRQELLQSKAGLYRGMLRIEVQEASPTVMGYLRALSTGLLSVRLLSSLVRRKR